MVFYISSPACIVSGKVDFLHCLLRCLVGADVPFHTEKTIPALVTLFLLVDVKGELLRNGSMIYYLNPTLPYYFRVSKPIPAKTPAKKQASGRVEAADVIPKTPSTPSTPRLGVDVSSWGS